MDFSSMAAQMLGVVEKAIIQFHNDLPGEIERTPVANRGGNNSFGPSSGWGNAAAAVGKSALNGVASTLGIDGFSQGPSMNYTVQFNPSSVTFAATGGGLKIKQSTNQAMNQAAAETVPKYVTMSFKLIFDDVFVDDAFLEAKLNSLNPGAQEIGKAAVKTVAKAAQLNKTTYSVRTQVEAFHAAARVGSAKAITFNYGKISYTGIITSINSNYVMFNTRGEPIRATVDVSMRLVDTAAGLNDWDAIYKEAFNGDNITAGSIMGNVSGLTAMSL